MPKSSTIKMPEEALNATNKFRTAFNRFRTPRKLKHIGILYAVLGSLLLSFAMLLCKKVKNLTGPEVSFLRTVTMSILTLIQCICSKTKLFDYKDRKCLLLARALCLTIGSSALFTSILLISLPDASSVKYCSVILTPFVARIFLTEKLSKLNIASAFTSMLGVALIANPFDVFGIRVPLIGSTNNVTSMMKMNSTSHIMRHLMVPEMSSSAKMTFGVFLAFLTSISEALGYCLGKKLSATVPKVAIVFNMSSYAILFTLPVCISIRIYMWSKTFQPQYAHLKDVALFPKLSLNDFGFVVAAGSLSMLGHLSVVSALKLERAGLVSIVRATDIIFSHVFQHIFFHTNTSILSIAGSALIVASVMTVSVWKIKRDRSAAANEIITHNQQVDAVELNPNNTERLLQQH
ncbi:hypothetical protein ACOME3_002658 [Neoechinorhynchus agilis]